MGKELAEKYPAAKAIFNESRQSAGLLDFEDML